MNDTVIRVLLTMLIVGFTAGSTWMILSESPETPTINLWSAIAKWITMGCGGISILCLLLLIWI